MIYVIGEARTGVVKIGTARDPRKRLAALQTGNPRDLRILATFEGGQPEEHRVHQAFAERRTSGEWFDFGEDDAVVEVAKVTARVAPRVASVAPVPHDEIDPARLRWLQSLTLMEAQEAHPGYRASDEQWSAHWREYQESCIRDFGAPTMGKDPQRIAEAWAHYNAGTPMQA